MRTITDCAIQINNEQCRNRCIFCKTPEQDFVARDHDVLVKDMYSQAINLKRRGLLNVEISGHDPIEYSHIAEFIAWLKKIGFRDITLATHGRNLSDKPLVEKLISSGLDCIRIPLYGSTASVHDSVTCSEGSFSDTMAGLENIRDSGIEICIVTLVLKNNKDDLDGIAGIAEKFGAELNVLNTGISNDYVRKYILTYKEMKEILPGFYSHCRNILRNKFNFFDFPYCLFGSDGREIIFTDVPKMSDTYVVPEGFRTDDNHLPDYRKMAKMDFCKKCIYSYICGGFREKHLLIFPKPDISIVPEDFMRN